MPWQGQQPSAKVEKHLEYLYFITLSWSYSELLPNCSKVLCRIHESEFSAGQNRKNLNWNPPPTNPKHPPLHCEVETNIFDSWTSVIPFSYPYENKIIIAKIIREEDWGLFFLNEYPLCSRWERNSCLGLPDKVNLSGSWTVASSYAESLGSMWSIALLFMWTGSWDQRYWGTCMRK